MHVPTVAAMTATTATKYDAVVSKRMAESAGAGAGKSSSMTNANVRQAIGFRPATAGGSSGSGPHSVGLLRGRKRPLTASNSASVGATTDRDSKRAVSGQANLLSHPSKVVTTL